MAFGESVNLGIVGGAVYVKIQAKGEEVLVAGVSLNLARCRDLTSGKTAHSSSLQAHDSAPPKQLANDIRVFLVFSGLRFPALLQRFNSRPSCGQPAEQTRLLIKASHG